MEKRVHFPINSVYIVLVRVLWPFCRLKNESLISTSFHRRNANRGSSNGSSLILRRITNIGQNGACHKKGVACFSISDRLMTKKEVKRGQCMDLHGIRYFSERASVKHCAAPSHSPHPTSRGFRSLWQTVPANNIPHVTQSMSCLSFLINHDFTNFLRLNFVTLQIWPSVCLARWTTNGFAAFRLEAKKRIKEEDLRSYLSF